MHQKIKVGVLAFLMLMSTAAVVTDLSVGTASAAPSSVDNFEYAIINGGTAVTITGYNGSGGNATIPSFIDGLPVVSISDYAFQANTNLTSVTMPDSVTYLGSYAFDGCSP